MQEGFVHLVTCVREQHFVVLFVVWRIGYLNIEVFYHPLQVPARHEVAEYAALD